MGIKHWQLYSLREQLQLLDIASAKKSLPRLAVEKDWWVTMTLLALSKTKYAELMSLKGGTSLSKAWSLIERFSEDIDIALRREGRFSISGVSGSQLAKARRVARHYVIRELPEELSTQLRALGIGDFVIEPETSREKEGISYELRADTHPSVIYIRYKSIVPEMSGYLSPRVKMEFSCLSMDEPVMPRTIISFISEVVPNADSPSVTFNAVLPSRTFLEKIFLLHEEFQRIHPRSLRMSRHLYDIERIMDTEFGRSALQDRKLYDDIVKHRSIFNHLDAVNYDNHSPATINFIPPDSVIEVWRKDYESLTRDFLYREGRTHLTFDELIARIQILQNHIREM